MSTDGSADGPASVDRKQTVDPDPAGPPPVAPDPDREAQEIVETSERLGRHLRADLKPKGKGRGKRKRARNQPTCRCPAYRWPHRPNGGLCRGPDQPPAGECPTPPGVNQPNGRRLRGSARQVVRWEGLHPIKDRDLIDRRLPGRPY